MSFQNLVTGFALSLLIVFAAAAQEETEEKISEEIAARYKTIK